MPQKDEDPSKDLMPALSDPRLEELLSEIRSGEICPINYKTNAAGLKIITYTFNAATPAHVENRAPGQPIPKGLQHVQLMNKEERLAVLAAHHELEERLRDPQTGKLTVKFLPAEHVDTIKSANIRYFGASIKPSAVEEGQHPLASTFYSDVVKTMTVGYKEIKGNMLSPDRKEEIKAQVREQLPRDIVIYPHDQLEASNLNVHVKHEILHAIGLSHDRNNPSLMYPNSGVRISEIQKIGKNGEIETQQITSFNPQGDAPYSPLDIAAVKEALNPQTAGKHYHGHGLGSAQVIKGQQQR